MHLILTDDQPCNGSGELFYELDTLFSLKPPPKHEKEYYLDYLPYILLTYKTDMQLRKCSKADHLSGCP